MRENGVQYLSLIWCCLLRAESVGMALSQEQEQKLAKLRAHLRDLPCAAVCFSGGVDSSLLLVLAKEELGTYVVAITEANELNPRREIESAKAFCQKLGVQQIELHHSLADLEGVAQNTPQRCYLCKKQLFSHMQEAADAWARKCGFFDGRDREGELATEVRDCECECVREREMMGERDGGQPGWCVPLLEGSNVSDASDYRPGHVAVVEHGAVSPLLEAGLTKQDIREISRELGISTWNKPSLACLASRIPYGAHLSTELLSRVDAAEQFLHDAGFEQVRARVYDGGSLACIEFEQTRIAYGFAFLRDGGAKKLHELGFSHVCVDADGYRTGSMNVGFDDVLAGFTAATSCANLATADCVATTSCENHSGADCVAATNYANSVAFDRNASSQNQNDA